MKLNFKVGDAITWMMDGDVVYRGPLVTLSASNYDAKWPLSVPGYDVYFNANGERRGGLAGKRELYFGDRVSIGIEGEEIPDRLKTAEVMVPAEFFNIHYENEEPERDPAFMVMPADIAKKYEDWILRQESSPVPKPEGPPNRDMMEEEMEEVNVPWSLITNYSVAGVPHKTTIKMPPRMAHQYRKWMKGK